MDPREAGKLGGRPSTAAVARSAAARAVASGSQRTLNFYRQFDALGHVQGHRQHQYWRCGWRAFDDAADGPADEADGQDEPADAADGAAA